MNTQTFKQKISGSDSRRVVVLNVQFILTVFALVLARSVRDAVYVSRAGVESLPWMYVAAGVLLPVSSLFYVRWLGSRRAWQHGAALQWVLAVGTAAVAGLLASGTEAAYPVLYLWVEIASAASMIHLWNVANSEFHPRQARRLYGYITAGQAIGNLGSGLFIQLTAQSIGPVGLIAAVAVASVISGVLYHLTRRFSEPVEHREQNKTDQALAQTEHSEKRYMRQLFIVVGLLYAACYLVDFQFKVFAARQLSEIELVHFFGLFYSIVGAAAVAVQLFFYRGIVRVIGLFASLTMVPATFFIGGLMLPFMPVLAVAAALKIGESGLRYALHEPVLQTLFLPLSLAMRARAQAVGSGVVRPIAACVAGMTLVLLSSNNHSTDIAAMLGFPIAAVALVVMGTILALRLGYLRLLVEETGALSGRIEKPVDLAYNPDNSLELMQAARNADPSTLSFVLMQVEFPAPLSHLEFSLRGLERSDLSYRVRARLIARMSEAIAAEALLRNVALDPLVATFLAVRAGRQRWQVLSSYLNCAEMDIVEATLITMFSLGVPEAALDALQTLSICMDSDRLQDRLLVVYMAEYLPEFDRLAELERTLINETDPKMIEAAIIMAERTGMCELAPLLVPYLVEPRYKKMAIRALRALGADGFRRIMQEDRVKGPTFWRAFGCEWEAYSELISRDPAASAELTRAIMLVESDPYFWGYPVLHKADTADRAVEELAWDAVQSWHTAYLFLQTRAKTSLDRQLCLSARIRLEAATRNLLALVFSRFHLPVENQKAAIYAPIWSNQRARNNLAEIADQYLPRADARRLLKIIDEEFDFSQVTRRSALAAFAQAIDPLSHLAGLSPSTMTELYMFTKENDIIENTLALSRVPLFANIPAENLVRIADLASSVHFAAGSKVSSGDQLKNSLLVIRTGTALVYGNRGILESRGPLSVIGSIGMTLDTSETTHIEAQTDLRCLQIEGTSFEALLDTYPMLARTLLRNMVEIAQSRKTPSVYPHVVGQ